jgi:hypothetical protein
MKLRQLLVDRESQTLVADELRREQTVVNGSNGSIAARRNLDP